MVYVIKMKQLRTFCLAMLLLLPQAVGSKSTVGVVLVTSSTTEIEQLDKNSLRKLFLGIPLKARQLTFEPVINQSDPDIYQGFLQHVMFMSDRKYERMTVSRVFRQGGTLPSTMNDIGDLVKHLSLSDNRISYMRHQDASQYAQLRIVQPLW